jgi:hypothetical protein
MAQDIPKALMFLCDLYQTTLYKPATASAITREWHRIEREIEELHVETHCSDPLPTAKYHSNLEKLRMLRLKSDVVKAEISKELAIGFTGPPATNQNDDEAGPELSLVGVPKLDRKAAVEAYCKSHGGIPKARVYEKARVDKSEYYAWERGERDDDSAVDLRIRRVLSE